MFLLFRMEVGLPTGLRPISMNTKIKCDEKQE